MNELLGYFMLLLMLLTAHFYLDYAGQGDFMAKAKNHKTPIPGVPWYQVLFAHAFLHAAAVLFITWSLTFFFVELVAHAAIDWAKSQGWIDFNADQALHVLCKIGYVAALAWTLA
ncbi:MAG: DUF3307 domain-containing protein [Gammaproteobacteria bacterium]|nr:DUF3307 domain-containing protein [Gammaproteobacteria bacterium]